MTKTKTRIMIIVIALVLVVVVGLIILSRWRGERPEDKIGKVMDEAKLAQRAPNSFPAADEDYFHDMDGGIPLTPEEVKGRNTWVVWTGGNDRLWDKLTVSSFGALDLLKTLSSHPSLYFSRDNRWNYLGLVNEPCFEKATGPNPDRFGLAQLPARPLRERDEIPRRKNRRSRH
jgi:hypothetical protein